MTLQGVVNLAYARNPTQENLDAMKEFATLRADLREAVAILDALYNPSTKLTLEQLNDVSNRAAALLARLEPK